MNSIPIVVPLCSMIVGFTVAACCEIMLPTICADWPRPVMTFSRAFGLGVEDATPPPEVVVVVVPVWATDEPYP